MTRAHRITTIYGPGGTHSEAVARKTAPAPGLYLGLANRFCVRCVANVDPTGGRVGFAGFLCARHAQKRVPA